jgi:hypothetical protein
VTSTAGTTLRILFPWREGQADEAEQQGEQGQHDREARLDEDARQSSR